MATQNIRIDYIVGKSQLEESNKELKEAQRLNDLTQKEVAETNDKFKDQEKQLSKTNKAFAGLGGQLTALGNKFTIAGKGAGDMAAGLFKTATATGGVSKAMKVLKYAIAATGIGALVIALGSLVTYFTKTQKGADIVSKAMAGISTAVSVVVDRLSAVGEGLINIFSGEWKKGLGQIKEAFKGIGEEIKNEVVAATELENRVAKLRDAEIAYIETKAKLNREIAASRLAVEEAQKADESLAESNKRRFAAAQKGIDAQNEMSRIEIELAKERRDILDAQLALGNNLTEDERNLAEAKAEVINLQAAQDEALKRLITRQNAFNKAGLEGIEIEKIAIGEKLANITTESETRTITEEEEAEMKIKREERILADMLKMQEEYAAQGTQISLAQAQELVKIDNAEKDAKKANLDSLVSSIGTAAGKGSIIGKAAALTAIAQDSAEAFAALTAASESNPANATTYGAAGVLQFLAGAARIGLNIANAKSIIESPTKFEKGGRIGGNLHIGGGTLIEAERDEFVMSRKATSKYGFDLMSKINNLELNDLTIPGKASSVNIIDTTQIAEQLKNMPQNIMNIDSQGFEVHQRRGQNMLSQKVTRYST